MNVPQGDEENSAGVVGVNAAALRVNVPLNTASSRCTPSQARPISQLGSACHELILPTIQSHLELHIVFLNVQQCALYASAVREVFLGCSTGNSLCAVMVSRVQVIDTASFVLQRERLRMMQQKSQAPKVPRVRNWNIIDDEEAALRH